MAQLEIRFLTAEKARAGRHVSFRRGYASLEHLRFVLDEACFIEQPLFVDSASSMHVPPGVRATPERRLYSACVNEYYRATKGHSLSGRRRRDITSPSIWMALLSAR